MLYYTLVVMCSMKTNLNDECKNLKNIIDNLQVGKETCEISSKKFSLSDVIDYLCEFEKELENLNSKIISYGNTPELLKEVQNKYNELWLFQLEYTIDSLVMVIGALWRYPNAD